LRERLGRLAQRRLRRLFRALRKPAVGTAERPGKRADARPRCRAERAAESALRLVWKVAARIFAMPQKRNLHARACGLHPTHSMKRPSMAAATSCRDDDMPALG
jgi:hypothetical protein